MKKSLLCDSLLFWLFTVMLSASLVFDFVFGFRFSSLLTSFAALKSSLNLNLETFDLEEILALWLCVYCFGSFFLCFFFSVLIYCDAIS